MVLGNSFMRLKKRGVAMNEPPYPADIEAKGWCLDLDYERIDQSDTWAIASAEQRPWLLMLWLVSWRQSPVASLPNNHKLIAARIGMPIEQFSAWSDVLLSGWWLASDGRLYHKTLTEQVVKMTGKRTKDRSRVAAYRSKSQATNDGVASCNALHTRVSTVSSTPPTTHHPPTNTPIPPKGADERFERFWKAYPKKVGKDAARRSFDKRKPTEELLGMMLTAIDQQSTSQQWTRDGGQYIPNPATWLNQGRWQDHTFEEQPNPFAGGI